VTAPHSLDWHCAALTRLVALLLLHCDAHDTRRVCEEISDTYLALWPVVRQSDEFRRLLRDLTGQAVEHTWQASTSASSELLLHTWLVLTVTHFQLARIDRTAPVNIPQSVLTVTRELCTCFQDKLVRLYWREESAESRALVQLRGGVTQLLSLAHELAAVTPSVWSKHGAMTAEQALVLLEAYPQSFKRVLRHVPFMLDTKEKVALLQHWIRADKEVHQPMEQGQISHIQIRRTHLLQDVFNKLAPPGTSLKRTVKIEFVNQAGLLEAGIDGGGLFRELVNEVIKTAFSPQYGLFKATEQQLLYPNPASALLVENDTDKFRFLGRLLGKCIYELCLVDVPFTEFFLAQLLDRPVAVHQLKSLDAALYKGLTALRSYQGAFEDLELNFTVTEDVSDVETSAVNLSSARIGTGRVVELIEQGSNIKVTRDNVEEYIALVAKYRMQTQIAEQCRAFKLGLCDVIDREWLSLLCWTESEFALLLNGEPLVHGIDIAAMQQHVVYAGGYHAHHPVILTFWEVLSEFTPEQQSMLLKYATSSPRPPLLGFGTLQPKFCIKLSSQDESYLPSANTCMNLLKLPAYHSKSTMRAKLLYAIQSNSGFDLS
jgi:ubiquitin-protein ligase E3 C